MNTKKKSVYYKWMQTNPGIKRQTEGIWANPKNAPGHKTGKEMLLLKEK